MNWYQEYLCTVDTNLYLDSWNTNPVTLWFAERVGTDVTFYAAGNTACSPLRCCKGEMNKVMINSDSPVKIRLQKSHFVLLNFELPKARHSRRVKRRKIELLRASLARRVSISVFTFAPDVCLLLDCAVRITPDHGTNFAKIRTVLHSTFKCHSDQSYS